jgi:hypothetical protein
LATSPSINRRLLSLSLVAIILVCAGLAKPFLDHLELAKVNAEAIREEIVTQEQQIRELEKRIPKSVKADELSFQERERLTAASTLIERRVFPWTRLLHDLESRLNNDVRVTQVNVELADPSRVDLLRPGTAPMKVSVIIVGRQLSNVLDLIRSLQATGRFAFRPRKQTSVEGTQEIEYEVEMLYLPG